MNLRITVFITTFLVILLGSNHANGQNDIGLRHPVFARLALSQRILAPLELNANKQEISFESSYSHSIGIGTGIDFQLSEPSTKKASWQLNTCIYFFSAPIRYNATQPAEIFGLDRDIEWSFERYISGLEGAIGFSRIHHLKKNWFMKLGAGVNLQDIFLFPNVLQANTIVYSDGEATNTTVVDNSSIGFGSTARTEQDIRFNGVFTIGFMAKLEQGNFFAFDFRACSPKQQVVEQFNLTFGSPGELVYRKGFVGLDISYIFPMNHKLAFHF